MIEISISKDYSTTPGSRHKDEGPYSGEDFRETVLEPKYKEAENKDEVLVINFDDSYGYPTSFLEEAFGGLARKYGAKAVWNRLKLISEDEPSLIDDVKEYIFAAN